MKTSIHSEQDIKDFSGKLPEGCVLVYFKMVGIGQNTLTEAGHSGDKVCQVANKQPGFFLISEDGSGLREAMHDLVDRFCNAQEGN